MPTITLEFSGTCLENTIKSYTLAPGLAEEYIFFPVFIDKIFKSIP